MPRDALEIVEQLALDLALGVGADAMDGLDQQVDQPVSERPTAQVCEGGKRRQPKRLGMPAKLVRSLDRDPLAIALDLVRPCMIEEIGWQPELADQIELGQLGLQAVDARPARIGAQMHQHRGNVAVGLIVAAGFGSVVGGPSKASSRVRVSRAAIGRGCRRRNARRGHGARRERCARCDQRQAVRS